MAGMSPHQGNPGTPPRHRRPKLGTWAAWLEQGLLEQSQLRRSLPILQPLETEPGAPGPAKAKTPGRLSRGSAAPAPPARGWRPRQPAWATHQEPKPGCWPCPETLPSQGGFGPQKPASPPPPMRSHAALNSSGTIPPGKTSGDHREKKQSWSWSATWGATCPLAMAEG